MKKILALLCMVTLSGVKASIGFSQEEKKQFIHKGLLRAQATISPGILLKGSSTISIHGGLEYYVADNVSIRSDGYYFLKDDQNIFSLNQSIFSGASYHFKTKNHFDPYFSFAPGISITKRNSYSAFLECLVAPCPGQINFYDNTAINPLLSSVVGFNFYFERWFHLFGEARYITGKYISNTAPPLSLNELRFSFGLGWNLSILKQKSPS